MLLDWSSSRLNWSNISRPMAGIIRVDEWVGSGAISTVWDTGSTVPLSRPSITGCILVVSEVSVCWVVGVDEWVSVGRSLCGLDIVVVLVVVVMLLLRLWLLIGLLLLLVVLVGLLWLSLLLLIIRFTIVGVMGSRVLSISTVRHMVAL